jgi:predicted nucleotidyltransferase
MPRTSKPNALPIFRSAAQARLLTELFVVRDGQPLSLTELSRSTATPLTTVQREIESLDAAGLVVSDRLGSMRLVSPNATSPYYHDLRSLLLKAFGPVRVLTQLLRGAHDVRRAFVFGSWARRYEGEAAGVAPRDIDVLVVGEPEPAVIYKVAREAERELGIEVNPLIVNESEWHTPSGLLRRIQAGPLVELPVHSGEQ